MILFFKIPSSSFTNILLIKIHQEVHSLTVTFFSLRNTVIDLFIKSSCSFTNVLLIKKHCHLPHQVHARTVRFFSLRTIIYFFTKSTLFQFNPSQATSSSPSKNPCSFPLNLLIKKHCCHLLHKVKLTYLFSNCLVMDL
jgi:hypothetical protein